MNCHMQYASNKPFANCYWVVPGRLMAGEYPLNEDVEESAVRLQNLLLVGVTRFINLTAPLELSEYLEHLPLRFGGKPVSMERYAIKDHATPLQPEAMTVILDRIEAALSAGDVVYVHCRAGIGRTGMVVGCYLARQGLNGDAALEQLNALWQDCGRASSWPVVPESEAQEQFVRSYAEFCAKANHSNKAAGNSSKSSANTPHNSTLHDRYQGAFLGLTIADVLARQWQQQPGKQLSVIARLDQSGWSGDTAMAWALADSLLQSGGMQPQDQMQRYLQLIRDKGYGVCADDVMSPLFTRAVAQWQWRHMAFAGAHDPSLLDPHPLVRTAAVVLYFAKQPSVCLTAAVTAARTTLQSPLVLDSCRVFAAVLLELLADRPVAQLVSLAGGDVFNALRALPLKPEIIALLDGDWRHALREPAGDDVVSILASALHALFTTHDYPSAIQRCVQQARRPAAVAAVCGALAGALYGVQGLPIIWRETLPRANELLKVADRLLVAAPAI
jgi:ADP-ribosylglycohydrolase